MTESKVEKAAEAMYAALTQCREAGLTGGVFSGHFCVWPVEAPHPHEGPSDFFDNVEMVGGVVLSNTHGMSLDGGAGT